MTSYPYDLHIHSCLSPCGDDDMTPNNLVGMAALSGCQVIAVTDHNSCKNAGAVMRAGEEAGLLVLPGMELCTAEEAHVVCLFETLEGAMAFDGYVYDHMPHVKNKPEIFGQQRILDENDELVGLEENLLLVSSFIGVNEVLALAESFAAWRSPPMWTGTPTACWPPWGPPPRGGLCRRRGHPRLRPGGPDPHLPELAGMKILRDSDSHYLETLAAGEPLGLHLPELSRRAVIQAIRAGAGE